MRTFFLAPDLWREPYCLQGSEAQHLTKVLRLAAGAEIRLLDGRGREGVFAITSADKRTVSLSPKHIQVHERPVARCTLALGYMRDIRRSWLLEKAVELEAGGLWFWQAERSQAKVPDAGKEPWQAQMEAGAKQSNNPWLPELRTLPGGVTELAQSRSAFQHAYLLWEGDTKGRVLSLEDISRQGDSLFVLGPEGGFSDKEVALLRKSDMEPVSLGPRVLRWETAALLCLGLCWWARASARPIPPNP